MSSRFDDGLILDSLEGSPGFVMEKVTRGIQHMIDQSIEEGPKILYLETIPRHKYILQRFGRIFKSAIGAYVPIYIIALILRLLKSRKSKKRSLFATVRDFFRSCLFSSALSLALPTSYAYLGVLHPKIFTSWWGVIVSFVFSLPVLLESKYKWREMSLYYGPQWMEAVGKSLHKQRLLPNIPHWEKLILLVSLGVISVVYYQPSPTLESPGKIEWMARCILGSPDLDVPEITAKADLEAAIQKLAKPINVTAPVIDEPPKQFTITLMPVQNQSEESGSYTESRYMASALSSPSHSDIEDGY